MNIALVRLSAIGDCALVLPVVRAILEQKPDANIYWLIGSAAYQLLQFSTHPRLHYVVVDKPKKLSDYLKIKKEFSDIDLDYVLAMQASSRANLIYPLLKAKHKIGFDKIRARELQWLFTNQRIKFKSEHLHDSFCQFAQLLEVNTERLNWTIELDTNCDIGNRFKLPSKFICINPAASKLERSWKASRYAALIDWFYQEYKITVVLTGSDVDFELELSKEIKQNCQRQPVDLVGKSSLPELAMILAKAQLLIAPDTGPAHIANGVGTPVIGLYAVASSKLSAPYNYQHLVIDQFATAVKTILKKDPDKVPWKTRVHDRSAMDLIDLEEVIKKVELAV